MVTTPDFLLTNKPATFRAVHGVNSYDSEVGSVGTPAVVFLTGLGMLLEIHTAEFLEGLDKVHSLGQLNLTEPGRQRQRSPRAPTGAESHSGVSLRTQPGQSQSPAWAEPESNLARARAQPGQSSALPAGLTVTTFSQGYQFNGINTASQLWPAGLTSLGN